MALARFERDFTDEAGNLLTGNVTVEVRRMTGGLPQLYSGRDGADALGNPFIHDGGRVAFHAAGNAYRVTVTQGLFSRELTYVALGLAGETDFTFARNQGEWDDAATYARGDYVIHEGFGLFISTEEGNLNHEPDSTTPGSTEFWTYYPGVAGPPGEGLHYDVQVDELADRSAFDAEAEGFSVLVSDVGDGRAAIYVMGSGGSGDWGAPAYVTGEPGAGDVTKAANRAALKALNTATNTVAYLTEGKRAGTFVWMSGDYSAWVTLDTEEGVYIPADSDPTGAAGVWMRVYAKELNVLWFGADPGYVSDSSPAIKCARDVLQVSGAYRGGVIRIPAGRYVCNSTIANTADTQVHNLYYKGDGENNTVLDFSGQTASTDGITFDPGSHFGVEGMTITGSKRNGISINPGVAVGSGSGTYSQNFVLRNLRLQQCTSAGVRLVNAFMGDLSNIWSTGNGASGFQLSGFHTSLHASRCWASGNGTAGVAAGWSINGVCYSTFTDCGSDNNTWGYAVSNVAGVTFLNCGAESNSRDAWLLLSSDSSATGVPATVQNITGLSLIDCFTIENALGAVLSYAALVNAVTANSRPISYRVVGGKSRVHTVGDAAFINQGTSGTVTANVSGHDTDGTTVDSGTVVHNDVVRTGDTQTLTGKTLTTPTLTLKQSAAPTPTAEGDIQWDTDDDRIVVGDGAGQKSFYPVILGTFTPRIDGTTVAGAGTYSVQAGNYTKIGNRVFFDIALTWSAHTGTGNISIAGLPFTVVGNHPADLYFSNLTYTANLQIVALVANGGTTITLAQVGNGAAASVIPMDTAGQLIISGSYRF